MSDCSGYGFGVQVNLSLDGAVGNGATANLTITVDDFIRSNFDGSAVIVNDWDGNEIKVDLTPIHNDYGFNDSDCTVEAFLLISPTTSNSGNLTLEFNFSNCLNSGGPNIFKTCGGAGPHRISQISTFTISNDPC